MQFVLHTFSSPKMHRLDGESSYLYSTFLLKIKFAVAFFILSSADRSLFFFALFTCNSIGGLDVDASRKCHLKQAVCTCRTFFSYQEFRASHGNDCSLPNANSSCNVSFRKMLKLPDKFTATNWRSICFAFFSV